MSTVPKWGVIFTQIQQIAITFEPVCWSILLLNAPSLTFVEIFVRQDFTIRDPQTCVVGFNYYVQFGYQKILNASGNNNPSSSKRLSCHKRYMQKLSTFFVKQKFQRMSRVLLFKLIIRQPKKFQFVFLNVIIIFRGCKYNIMSYWFMIFPKVIMSYFGKLTVFGSDGGSRWDWFCGGKKVGELCGSFLQSIS